MEKKIIFQKLTPADGADIKVYDEAMQYIFDNADIKNIAISGSYGAGKSSLIETLKKRYSDKKFLTVSLAHFTEQNANIDNMDNVETVLEGKILNQLIHTHEVLVLCLSYCLLQCFGSWFQSLKR